MSGCSHGPVSTLPGHEFKCPHGTLCDTNHEDGDRLAIKRIQGETDSMGCETIDMCQECYDLYLKEKDNPEATKCEWCNTISTDCKPTRDIDEGMFGPVYEVCVACRRKQNKAAQEELDSYEETDSYYD